MCAPRRGVLYQVVDYSRHTCTAHQRSHIAPPLSPYRLSHPLSPHTQRSSRCLSSHSRGDDEPEAAQQRCALPVLPLAAGAAGCKAEGSEAG